MNKSLRFISISHKTASVTQREEFHIPEEEKSDLVKLIFDAFSRYFRLAASGYL